MSNGPVNFARDHNAVDALLAAPPTWDGLLADFLPAPSSQKFEPEANVKLILAGMYTTPSGRDAIHWLLDITVFAPYPHVGPSFETAALAAKAHEARAAVGSVLMKAISDGMNLMHKKEPNT